MKYNNKVRKRTHSLKESKGATQLEERRLVGKSLCQHVPPQLEHLFYMTLSEEYFGGKSTWRDLWTMA